jgi:GT2 family glycosyltransferase
MIKASIIIHNYNRASVLQKCLISVEQQGFRPLEIVILDAGSKDNSHEVIACSIKKMLQEGIEVKFIPCQPLGVAASRNLGARNASGHIMCFLDNDARFISSESVEQMVRLFQSHPDLGVISFRILNGDTDEIDPYAWVFRRSHKDWSTRSFNTFTFAGCGFCVASAAFSDAGGFWDHLKYSREEEDLALALLDSGWELRYSPEIVVRHYFDPRGRLRIIERRRVELRNGIMVLWRRFPRPFALLAIIGRIGTMTWKVVFREKNDPSEFFGAVSEAVWEYRENGLKRHPVSMKTFWKYLVLHLDRSVEEMHGKS